MVIAALSNLPVAEIKPEKVIGVNADQMPKMEGEIGNL